MDKTLNQDGTRMQELQFNLTLDETNLVLEALGGMPFVRVHQLIAKMQQQAHAQLQVTKDPTSLENLTRSEDER
jgi:hypothetical protein